MKRPGSAVDPLWWKDSIIYEVHVRDAVGISLESAARLGTRTAQLQKALAFGSKHLAERRAKKSPLKDVAGMLRSLSHAAYAALMNYTAPRPEDLQTLDPWAQLWERSTGAEFLRAYREATEGSAFLPRDAQTFRRLLAIFWLDKALYELSCELNNPRSAWVRIPLMGILSLPTDTGGREWHHTPSHTRT